MMPHVDDDDIGVEFTSQECAAIWYRDELEKKHKQDEAEQQIRKG